MSEVKNAAGRHGSLELNGELISVRSYEIDLEINELIIETFNDCPFNLNIGDSITLKNKDNDFQCSVSVKSYSVYKVDFVPTLDKIIYTIQFDLEYINLQIVNDVNEPFIINYL